MYHPSREMAQLPQVPQIKNGKPDYSPTFQKVELHNSTFFQQPALSLGRLVRPSVRITLILRCLRAVFAILLLPKCLVSLILSLSLPTRTRLVFQASHFAWKWATGATASVSKG